MLNSIEQGTLAAVITDAKYKQTSAGYNQVKYTTEDPHNFQVGQSVTVYGITGGTSANIDGLPIVNIPSVNSFIVSSTSAFVTSTTPVIGTGSSAVTAVVTNSWANLYTITYASAEPSTVAPQYNEVNPNIQANVGTYPAEGNTNYGLAAFNLTWAAPGGANPPAIINIIQTLGSTTTTISTAAPSSGSTTVYGVTDATYTFGITASNSFATRGPSTAAISAAKFISSMSSITATATAGVANSITINWQRPNVSSPAPITYELQRASSSDNSTWSAWTTLSNSIVGTASSYVDSTALDLIYYKYQVRAYNGLYSSYLESSSTRAYYITSPMTTPTVTYASSTNKSLSVNVSNYISNPVIASWKIERSTTGTSGWSTIATAATSLPYVDSTVDLSTTYYYRLSGNNGQLSSDTSAASTGLLTYSVPNAPTNIAAAPSGSVAYQIDVTWTAATIPSPGMPAVSSYTLERSVDQSTWVVVSSGISGSATSYGDTDRELYVDYYYRLTAVNAVGSSVVSSTATTVINLQPNTPTISVATNTSYNTAASITATTTANRSVKLQTSTDDTTWSDVETKTANSSGNVSFSYTITRGTTLKTYFRVIAAQDALYLTGTSASTNTTTVNNTLTMTSTWAGWASWNGSYYTEVQVTDVNGSPVSGATVDWYYRQYGFGGASYTGYSNTTDSNGKAGYYWNSTESRSISTNSSKSNYNSGSTGYIHTEYIEQTATFSQTDYGSYSEVNSWGTKTGTDGWMYSGYWSTTHKRQVSAAFFNNSGLWDRVHSANAITGASVNITRKAGTGGSSMQAAIGVHNSLTNPGNFNSLGSLQSIQMWGPSNTPAYSASANNNSTIDLSSIKDKFSWANGLSFGYTSEASSQTNYCVLSGATLYVSYRANPFA